VASRLVGHLVGHRVHSPPKGGTDTKPEADTSADDPERDPDECERGGRPGRVVDEQSEDQTDDDGSGEKAPETHEVATSQCVLGTLIGHPPKSLSSAGLKTSAR